MSSCSGIDLDFDNIVAIDCEMVVGEGKPVMVARVSIVDWYGNCIYNMYVKPTRRAGKRGIADELPDIQLQQKIAENLAHSDVYSQVLDYCTPISGITAKHLAKGIHFRRAHKEVANIIKSRILVGHTVSNDLKSLGCSHPIYNIRDISEYHRYQRNNPPYRQSLQFLAKQFLGIDIQHGAHDSIVDARAAMWLYQQVAKQWEEEIQEEDMEEEKDTSERYYYSSSSS